MRLVMFGPQGAGKGTQSARIAEKYGIPSIATGDIFRWAIKGGTSLGGKVKQYVEAGNLVPDELTIETVRERLTADDCEEGFLLDGFPRSVPQAEALDEILAEKDRALDAALVLQVPEEVSLRRLTGRRVCSNCGRNYSLDSPPEKNWTCDVCGGPVTPRADDEDEEAIRARLRSYHDTTEPLKVYYGEKGILREVDGTQSPDDVFSSIVSAL
ncbi:MAG: adenylate kinase [Actinobacteria bacterium]|nr:adenylate kinase [Actinomycetota bacterium]